MLETYHNWHKQIAHEISINIQLNSFVAVSAKGMQDRITNTREKCDDRLHRVIWREGAQVLLVQP